MGRYLVLIILTVLSSCDSFLTQEFKPENIKFEEKYVIESFIGSLDTILYLEARYLEPGIGVFAEENSLWSPAEDLSPAIFVDNGKVDFFYDNSRYRSIPDTIAIAPGKEYYLDIITPEGDAITASCIVPSVTPDSSKIEISRENEGYIIKFDDIKGTKNYYRYHIIIESRNTTLNTSRITGDRPLKLIDDEGIDGERISHYTEALPPTRVFTQASLETIHHLYLFTLDENYGEFLISLETYDKIKGNEFATPFNLYSNMNGGLGIFGCYNATEIFY